MSLIDDASLDEPVLPEVGSLRLAVWVRIRPERGHLLRAMVTLVISTASTLAGPLLIRYAIDHRKGPHGLSTLNIVTVIFFATAIVATVANQTQIRLVGAVGERFLFRLRQEVFTHLQSLSLSFYDSERTGRLVARMTSDFDAMEALVQQGLILLVTNLLIFATTVVILVVLSWQLFLICLLVVPLLYRSSRKFSRDSKVAYLQVRERVGQTMVTVEEGISGVRVVQAYGREDQQAQRFSRRNRAQLQANLHAVRVSTRYFPVIESSSVITIAAMVGIGGGIFVPHKLITIGTVVAFLLLLNSLFDPIQQMSNLFQQVQQSGAALRKVLGILAVQPEVVQANVPSDLRASGALEFLDVGFSYSASGPQVLNNVNLTVRAGERLALVGPTGAGKSTLAKLIARLYDPTEGSVIYGGIDLRQASFASLRQRIVMVPQEGFLIHGSLLDNVRLARPSASDDDVRSALLAIGALERFESVPGGLGTIVEGGGATFSAGERQLLALARAALIAPDVLVLDEATSSLDPGTEAAVEAAMNSLAANRTTIVIAHRLSTALTADRVVVVADGYLAEIGTHAQLMERGGRYAAMYGSWESAGRIDD